MQIFLVVPSKYRNNFLVEQKRLALALISTTMQCLEIYFDFLCISLYFQTENFIWKSKSLCMKTARIDCNCFNYQTWDSKVLGFLLSIAAFFAVWMIKQFLYYIQYSTVFFMNKRTKKGDKILQ